MCSNGCSPKWCFPLKWAVFLHLNVLFGRKIFFFSTFTLRNRNLHHILRRNSCYRIFSGYLFFIFYVSPPHLEPHMRVRRPKIANWQWPSFLTPRKIVPLTKCSEMWMYASRSTCVCIFDTDGVRSSQAQGSAVRDCWADVALASLRDRGGRRLSAIGQRTRRRDSRAVCHAKGDAGDARGK